MSTAGEAARGQHLDHALAQRVALGHDFYFVQIGAFDGRTDDPLYGWVRAYRWRGLLVEPQARFFAELRNNYAGVEGLEFRQVAVGDRRETRTLYTVADGPGVDPHVAGMLASFDQPTLLSHRQYLQTLLPHRESVPEIDALVRREEVECVPLNDLLVTAPTDHIDLLQIDVEGYDHELVRALDIERFAPSIVRFEHRHLTSDQHQSSIDRLIAHGYRVCLEKMDTLAYRPADLPHGPPRATWGGPGRLQREHEAQIAELEERLAAANAWTEQLARDLADLRERSLAGQHAALTAQIEQATVRAEQAERRIAELEGGGPRPEPGQDP